MEEMPYIDYHREDMILRDFLALHRSILANERTFLSYLRTALALIAGGLTFVKIFDDLLFIVFGWLMMPSGVIIGIWGFKRFYETKTQFSKIDVDNKDKTEK